MGHDKLINALTQFILMHQTVIHCHGVGMCMVEIMKLSDPFMLEQTPDESDD